MTFANPLPWWAIALVVAVAASLAWRAYTRTSIPLAPGRRRLLVGLRLLTLLTLVVVLLRPVAVEPDPAPRDETVIVLVDSSRSMRLTDVDNERRIDRASRLLTTQLIPALSREFRVELLGFADGVSPAEPARLDAGGMHTNLTGALEAVKERYRGQKVAGVVVISDGGNTAQEPASEGESAWPVYPIGLGSTRVGRDHEVVGVTVGQASLADSVVELGTSVVSHGYGRAPIEMRVLENGRPIQVRQVTPADDGSPTREVFQVSPSRDAATLYTVEIPRDPNELVPENNSRSVLVRPPGRKRRVLVVQGAPGFEHSFLARAWSQDPGLEVDAVVRKGQNERGEDTFYVQAASTRAALLAQGYPQAKETLFGYDAVVLANIEGDFFSREHLGMTADYVAERGGGLLVLGARSFTQGTYSGTPLEEVMPVELTDRGSGVVRTAGAPAAEPNKLVLTPDGEAHPIMRLGTSVEESRTRWAAMPALASSASLGGARAGASILAVTAAAGGTRPLVAVQRYGRGRSMLFAGEASWRWRMMVAATDRTFETFWRQAVRWLAMPSPDPVSVMTPGGLSPGEPVSMDVYARDPAFAPVRDATVSVRVSGPGAAGRDLETTLADTVTGRYTAVFRPDQPGVYRVSAEVRRRGAIVGTAEDWMLVGGADDELADPRLNDEVLRRLAGATGGEFLTEAEAAALPGLLRSRSSAQSPPQYRDLWHNGWTFGVIVLLLGIEWAVRRQGGMR
jgi:uncharacterized membrane protein